MSIVTAILSGLPLLGKLIDRFFPDTKDERAETRRALQKTKAFAVAAWVPVGLVLYEIFLRTMSWLFPDNGLPESILAQLEWALPFLSIYFGYGG